MYATEVQAELILNYLPKLTLPKSVAFSSLMVSWWTGSLEKETLKNTTLRQAISQWLQKYSAVNDAYKSIKNTTQYNASGQSFVIASARMVLQLKQSEFGCCLPHFPVGLWCLSSWATGVVAWNRYRQSRYSGTLSLRLRAPAPLAPDILVKIINALLSWFSRVRASGCLSLTFPLPCSRGKRPKKAGSSWKRQRREIPPKTGRKEESRWCTSIADC